MKRFLSCIVITLFLTFFNYALAESKKVILYSGQGCPHCAKVEEYITKNNFDFQIEVEEVYQNKENAQEFNNLCEKESIELLKRGVPLLYTQDGCYIGDREIISYLQGKRLETKNDDSRNHQTKNDYSKSLTIPILISAALVDSINPCEFAVLLILMTTILAAGNKKRALLSGLAYSASIFISYYLMGLGLYSVIASIQTSNLFIRIIGAIAIILGIINLKDFFWYGKFFIMEVPLSWRPKLKKMVKSITGPLSAFFIGFIVSLFLLPCTSGPYIVIIGMLGHSEIYLDALILLAFYNLIFILPMILITIGVYFGLDVNKAEETRTKNLKVLHLIAGLVMLIMGLVLVTGIF